MEVLQSRLQHTRNFSLDTVALASRRHDRRGPRNSEEGGGHPAEPTPKTGGEKERTACPIEAGNRAQV